MSASVLHFIQRAAVQNLETRDFIQRAQGGAIKVFTQDISDLRKKIEEEALKRSGLFVLSYFPIPGAVVTENAELIVDRVQVEFSILAQVKTNPTGMSALELAEMVLGAGHFFNLPKHPAITNGAVLQAREERSMELLPAPDGYNKVNVHLFVPDVRLFSPNA